MNLTSTWRQFSVLSQQIVQLLNSSMASNEETSGLIDSAHAQLTAIWPFYPIISAPGVENYGGISARF